MTLEVNRRDEICELRLNAPPGNVVDRATCLAMTEAIRTHAADKDLKAFLFTAAGKHFSYGASVAEHVKGEAETFLPAFHGVFYALAEAGVPTLAAVRGLCLGGAFELAAFCQYLVAETSASFAVPEITLSVLPPVACVVLPWRAGGAVADDLIMSGRKMRADDPRLGVHVCEEGDLDGEIERLLDTAIRPHSAAVLRLAVQAVRGPLHDAVRTRLPELERQYLTQLMDTRDANEGIAAFLEKRKPEWVNA